MAHRAAESQRRDTIAHRLADVPGAKVAFRMNIHTVRETNPWQFIHRQVDVQSSFHISVSLF